MAGSPSSLKRPVRAFQVFAVAPCASQSDRNASNTRMASWLRASSCGSATRNLEILTVDPISHFQSTSSTPLLWIHSPVGIRTSPTRTPPSPPNIHPLYITALQQTHKAQYQHPNPKPPLHIFSVFFFAFSEGLDPGQGLRRGAVRGDLRVPLRGLGLLG